MAQQNNLDFNIAANVKGMEQIATLINRVNALEAETKKLASANANLTNSNNSVIQSGTRYNNALDAQSKQLRNARQGTQQLGMQINDFATSVSTGASVSQAFNQQLGQVGYAMSMMGGTAGKVGAFLAGPWGALITVGVMALSPLIDKLWQVVSGAKAAEGALYDLGKRRQAEMNRRTELPRAESELNALLKERDQLQKDIAKRGVRDSQGRLMFVYREQKALEEVNKQIFEARQNIDFGRSEKYGSFDKVFADLNKPVKAVSAKLSGGGGVSSARSSEAAAEKAAKRLAKIEEETAVSIAKSKIFWAEYWADREDEIARNGIDAMQQRTREIGYIADETGQIVADQIQKPLDELQNSFETIGNSISSAFRGMISGATSWRDALRGIIGAVIDELWRLYVVQQIVGFVTKAIGGIGLPLPAPVPGKAVGGYVGAQQPYVVGEKGPELFIPGGSGTIIPNKNMAMGSGSGGVTVNVDARGSADPAAVRAQVEAGIIQAAPAIIAAAQQRTVSSLRRPKLGGAMQ